MTDQEFEKIEEQISSGKIKMRPRLYFVLRSGLLFVTALLIFVTAIFLASVLFFEAHRNGWWLLASFGWHGWVTFFQSLPWIIILLVVVLIVLVEMLGWFFSAMYRRPAVYTVAGIVLIVLGVGFIIDRSHVHEYMRRHSMMLMRPLYNELDTFHPHNIFFGQIVETSTAQWSVVGPNGDIKIIIISPNTILPPNAEFNFNDHVAIFGDGDDATITARGIKSLDVDTAPDRIREQWPVPPPPLQ